MTTPTDLQNQMKSQQEDISRMQRLIERHQYTAKVNYLASERARAAAEIPTLQAQINKVQQELAATKNKYYEASGQYDKLMSGDERDAYMGLTSLFKNYGLESLAGKIFEFVKNGYSADTISIMLQDTPEYKQRFAANEARRKAGLPVLNPADYLATENAYRQVMQEAGLPKGFYDTNSDFTDFISRNVSPSEVQKRVDLAVQASTMADDNVKKALKQIGIGDTDITAYFLDKDRALPFLTQSVATAKLGAEALAQGLTFDSAYMEQLAKRGITADAARQGYAGIADEMTTLSTLGSIYGEEWNQRESERAMFEGSAAAVQKKKRLASQERGAFSGSAGGARGGLAQRGGARA